MRKYFSVIPAKAGIQLAKRVRRFIRHFYKFQPTVIYWIPAYARMTSLKHLKEGLIFALIFQFLTIPLYPSIEVSRVYAQSDPVMTCWEEGIPLEVCQAQYGNKTQPPPAQETGNDEQSGDPGYQAPPPPVYVPPPPPRYQPPAYTPPVYEETGNDEPGGDPTYDAPPAQTLPASQNEGSGAPGQSASELCLEYESRNIVEKGICRQLYGVGQEAPITGSDDSQPLPGFEPAASESEIPWWQTPLVWGSEAWEWIEDKAEESGRSVAEFVEDAGDYIAARFGGESQPDTAEQPESTAQAPQPQDPEWANKIARAKTDWQSYKDKASEENPDAAAQLRSQTIAALGLPGDSTDSQIIEALNQGLGESGLVFSGSPGEMTVELEDPNITKDSIPPAWAAAGTITRLVDGFVLNGAGGAVYDFLYGSEEEARISALSFATGGGSDALKAAVESGQEWKDTADDLDTLVFNKPPEVQAEILSDPTIYDEEGNILMPELARAARRYYQTHGTEEEKAVAEGAVESSENAERKQTEGVAQAGGVAMALLSGGLTGGIPGALANLYLPLGVDDVVTNAANARTAAKAQLAQGEVRPGANVIPEKIDEVPAVQEPTQQLTADAAVTKNPWDDFVGWFTGKSDEPPVATVPESQKINLAQGEARPDTNPQETLHEPAVPRPEEPVTVDQPSAATKPEAPGQSADEVVVPKTESEAISPAQTTDGPDTVPQRQPSIIEQAEQVASDALRKLTSQETDIGSEIPKIETPVQPVAEVVPARTESEPFSQSQDTLMQSAPDQISPRIDSEPQAPGADQLDELATGVPLREPCLVGWLIPHFQLVKNAYAANPCSPEQLADLRLKEQQAQTALAEQRGKVDEGFAGIEPIYREINDIEGEIYSYEYQQRQLGRARGEARNDPEYRELRQRLADVRNQAAEAREARVDPLKDEYIKAKKEAAKAREELDAGLASRGELPLGYIDPEIKAKTEQQLADRGLKDDDIVYRTVPSEYVKDGYIEGVLDPHAQIRDDYGVGGIMNAWELPGTGLNVSPSKVGASGYGSGTDNVLVGIRVGDLKAAGAKVYPDTGAVIGGALMFELPGTRVKVARVYDNPVKNAYYDAGDWLRKNIQDPLKSRADDLLERIGLKEASAPRTPDVPGTNQADELAGKVDDNPLPPCDISNKQGFNFVKEAYAQGRVPCIPAGVIDDYNNAVEEARRASAEASRIQHTRGVDPDVEARARQEMADAAAKANDLHSNLPPGTPELDLAEGASDLLPNNMPGVYTTSPNVVPKTRREQIAEARTQISDTEAKLARKQADLKRTQEEKIAQEAVAKQKSDELAAAQRELAAAQQARADELSGKIKPPKPEGLPDAFGNPKAYDDAKERVITSIPRRENVPVVSLGPKQDFKASGGGFSGADIHLSPDGKITKLYPIGKEADLLSEAAALKLGNREEITPTVYEIVKTTNGRTGIVMEYLGDPLENVVSSGAENGTPVRMQAVEAVGKYQDAVGRAHGDLGNNLGQHIRVAGAQNSAGDWLRLFDPINVGPSQNITAKFEGLHTVTDLFGDAKLATRSYKPPPNGSYQIKNLPKSPAQQAFGAKVIDGLEADLSLTEALQAAKFNPDGSLTPEFRALNAEAGGSLPATKPPVKVSPQTEERLARAQTQRDAAQVASRAETIKAQDKSAEAGSIEQDVRAAEADLTEATTRLEDIKSSGPLLQKLADGVEGIPLLGPFARSIADRFDSAKTPTTTTQVLLPPPVRGGPVAVSPVTPVAAPKVSGPNIFQTAREGLIRQWERAPIPLKIAYIIAAPVGIAAGIAVPLIAMFGPNNTPNPPSTALVPEREPATDDPADEATAPAPADPATAPAEPAQPPEPQAPVLEPQQVSGQDREDARQGQLLDQARANKADSILSQKAQATLEYEGGDCDGNESIYIKKYSDGFVERLGSYGKVPGECGNLPVSKPLECRVDDFFSTPLFENKVMETYNQCGGTLGLEDKPVGKSYEIQKVYSCTTNKIEFKVTKEWDAPVTCEPPASFQSLEYNPAEDKALFCSENYECKDYESGGVTYDMVCAGAPKRCVLNAQKQQFDKNLQKSEYDNCVSLIAQNDRFRLSRAACYQGEGPLKGKAVSVWAVKEGIDKCAFWTYIYPAEASCK